jgi:hypothetical protein
MYGKLFALLLMAACAALTFAAVVTPENQMPATANLVAATGASSMPVAINTEAAIMQAPTVNGVTPYARVVGANASAAKPRSNGVPQYARAA